VKPKEARTCVELRQNNENHEGVAGDLRAELRKLKQAYEAVCLHKDSLVKEKDDEIQKLKNVSIYSQVHGQLILNPGFISVVYVW
jgi:hypothetical protein